MDMLGTAEVVAQRYGIGRAAQDEFAVESHRRAALAQSAGHFDEEEVRSPFQFPRRLSIGKAGEPTSKKSCWKGTRASARTQALNGSLR